ncbi:hypothetical protein LTR73_002003 [Friedmanniomyces endolithicus]|nr:hypothetical protein LTR73_002003 [Friedmanniomyces endolithicus]
MATSTRTVRATCLCAAAAHDISLPAFAFPLQGIFCHCDSDRHSTGCMSLGIAVLPPEYELPSAWISKLQSTVFSQRLKHYFCPICGTMMLVHLAHDNGESGGGAHWDVCTGALEQLDGVVEFDCHELLSDTRDGGFSDFLQRVDGKTIARWAGEPGGEQLPQYWRSAPLSSTTAKKPTSSSASREERLHAYCRCRGVEFWISRPNSQSTQGITSPWPDVLHPYHSPSTPDDDENPTWWLRANNTKYLAGTCACDSCRLATGQEHITWAFVPTPNISLDAAGSVPFSRTFGTLRSYRSSEGVTRHFCGSCGATVFLDGDERPLLVDVAVGVLDAREGSRAEGWLEWWTGRLSFREDALGRARGLTEGVEEGMGAFGRHLAGAGRGGERDEG